LIFLQLFPGVYEVGDVMDGFDHPNHVSLLIDQGGKYDADDSFRAVDVDMLVGAFSDLTGIENFQQVTRFPMDLAGFAESVGYLIAKFPNHIVAARTDRDQKGIVHIGYPVSPIDDENILVHAVKEGAVIVITLMENGFPVFFPGPLLDCSPIPSFRHIYAIALSRWLLPIQPTGFLRNLWIIAFGLTRILCV
jgi:hypothetical protein